MADRGSAVENRGMAGRSGSMRAILTTCLVALTAPVSAWEFTETDICTVTHDAADVTVTLTFDPATDIYDIALALSSATWGDGSNFRIVFDGPNPIAIGTDRQNINDGRTTLNVSDSGFGNVLDGIQFNRQMTASLGAQSITIPLAGAAEPMVAFRLCPSAATS